MSADTFLTIMTPQEANITRNPFNPTEQRNDKVQFFEVLREKAAADKHQLEKVQNDKLREDQRARDLAAQDFAKAKRAENAHEKREALKEQAAEAAAEHRRAKQSNDSPSASDMIGNDDTSDTKVETFDGLFGSIQTRAVNDSSNTGEKNALENTVSVQSNPLNTSQLETGNLDQNTLNFLKNLSALTEGSTPYINASLDTTFGAFGTPESLYISNTLGLSQNNATTNIEGFLGNLKALYNMQDPAATLANLTPQQISELQRAADSQLSLASEATNAADILSELLNLQNIQAANSEAADMLQNLGVQNMGQTSPVADVLNLQIHDEIAAIIGNLVNLVPANREAHIATNTSQAASAAQNDANLQAQQAAIAASQNTDNDTDLLHKPLLTPTGAMINKDGEGENAYNMAMERANAQSNVTGRAEAEALMRMENIDRAGERREMLNIPPQGAKGESSAKLAAGIAQSMANTSGLLFPPAELQSFADELNLIAGQGQSTQSISLTNLVTSSQQAGQSHPATQMVAATIQKSAGPDGMPKQITLQLDPPELGRVEVKMNFDEGSTIKAVVTVEKPETHLMMQRDAQVLERALQDAGLDAEGGLSFELASEGYDFNQDNGHDGSEHGSGSASDGENEELDVIESTMTWQVDENTGHTHYSILA